MVTTSTKNCVPTTLLQLLQEGERCLKMAGLPNGRQQTDLLVSLALKVNRLQLYVHLGDAAPAGVCKRARELFVKRATGTPLQYLLGVQEFWGLEFIVTPDVLIPRPETEIVVEETIKLINVRQKAGSSTIVDLGTGCGCIAIALSKSLPHARILATDISGRALAIARRNAKRLGIDQQVTFLKGDLFEPFKKQPMGWIDMIVANPPYVPSGELQTLAPEVKDHEPRVALDGGSDGLDLCRRILQEAPDHLVPGGTLLMEIGWKQARSLREWIHQQAPTGGLSWEIRFENDLAGIERVAILTPTPLPHRGRG